MQNDKKKIVAIRHSPIVFKVLRKNGRLNTEFGCYKIEAPIDFGSEATIFLAADPTNTPVAIRRTLLPKKKEARRGAEKAILHANSLQNRLSVGEGQSPYFCLTTRLFRSWVI